MKNHEYLTFTPRGDEPNLVAYYIMENESKKLDRFSVEVVDAHGETLLSKGDISLSSALVYVAGLLNPDLEYDIE